MDSRPIIFLCLMLIPTGHSQHYRSYSVPYGAQYEPRVAYQVRAPLPPSRISPHLSRIMPIRPIRHDSYYPSASKPKLYRQSAPYSYRAYPQSYLSQPMMASPSRNPYRVVYAPPPVYPISSPYRRMTASVYTPKSVSYDMESSGSGQANVRYVPVVKKVTHHHIHHIVASPKSQSHLNDPQNVAQLNNLLIKSLYKLNSRTENSGDTINLLADGSSQVPVKIHNTEHETKQLEVENEPEKNLNHEIVFEDEDSERDPRLVQVFNPGAKSMGSRGKDGKPKKTLVYKIDPSTGADANQYIKMMRELAKTGAPVQTDRNEPYYSLFLGVPETTKSEPKTKPGEHGYDDSEEKAYIDMDNNQQQYLIASRRSDGDADEVEISKPKLIKIKATDTKNPLYGLPSTSKKNQKEMKTIEK